ncbi:MAG: hypothetical protein ABI740_00875 [Alphaproteobacteria bacterium]
MSRRLFHFLLAVVVAFVFTGRMEAAASHCRGLAASTNIAMGDMDMSVMPGMNMPTMPDCHGADHSSKTHSPANEPCECLALLTADFPVIETARRASRLVHFTWEAPEAIRFASLEAAPDHPPPRL